MNEQIEKFRTHVIELSNNTESFVHHQWFVTYHLVIVEKIALELCERYPAADKNAVLALVWVHDYAKILDKESEHDERMFEKGREKLLEVGFETAFVDMVISYLSILEKKMEIDLHTAPIEVKIVSSADGASHLVGPFCSIYFKENSEKTVEELLGSNRNKLKKDWERKIVLPEVKKAFQQRHDLSLEQNGIFPEKFLN